MSERRQLVKAYVLPGLRAELRDAAELRGKSESSIIEDALRSHLQWLRMLAGKDQSRGK